MYKYKKNINLLLTLLEQSGILFINNNKPSNPSNILGNE